MQPYISFHCPFALPQHTVAVPVQDAPSTALEQVRGVLQRRRLRNATFAEVEFADPAWDILLDLYCSALEHHQVSVSSACIASGVPATTAMRWLVRMERQGLIERSKDDRDGRRVYVTLTATAFRSMSSWVASAFKLVPEHATADACP